jgi:hypothetical protein
MAIDFPNSPSTGDTYTTNGKTYRWDGTVWGVYGTFTVDSTASDTEPTGVGNGHIWYRSDQSQTLIRYNDTWVEVGSAGGFDSSSTSFPSSLDSGTGFAAVEALQAKVGVNGSAVTSSHDYLIATHGKAVSFTPTWANGLTAGNATESWVYAVINNMLIVQGSTTLGSTSTMSVMPLGMTLPTGAHAAGATTPCGSAFFVDAGVSTVGTVNVTNSSTVQFAALDTSGTYAAFSGVTSTVPFTWGTGDEIRATFAVLLD